jgi:hypothetical protein
MIAEKVEMELVTSIGIPDLDLLVAPLALLTETKLKSTFQPN